MNPTCHPVRERWLERLEEGVSVADAPALEPHIAGCGECRAWVRSVEAQVRLFRSVSPRPAPAELEARVVRRADVVLEDRLADLLSSLPAVPAPAELDARVATDLAEERGGEDLAPEETLAPERLTRQEGLLRSLSIQPAPSVLDRLVAEELAAPERHRVERFTALERREAPASLERRLDRSLRWRTARRALAGPLATLAAAGLLVWVAVQGDAVMAGDPPVVESTERPRPFRVVRVTRADELSPLARGLMGALAPSSLVEGDDR